MSYTQSKFGQSISAHAAARYWQRHWHAIPGGRELRAGRSHRHIFIAGHHARLAGHCVGTSLSFARAKKRRSKVTGHACAAARMKLLVRWPWCSGPRANSRSRAKRACAWEYWRGLSGRRKQTLRRAFLQVTGLKPRELAEALRIKRFKAMLRAGKSITDALYETGYGSSSRVYERSNAHWA